MKPYLDLMQDILDNGYQKGDRTGTGTLSVFGRQLHFDLSEGFPLLTTKKLHIRSIIYELLWFLNGDTNIQYLTDNNVHIWSSWANEQGELGPIYGNRWRSWGQPKSIIAPKPKLRSGLKATYLGVANGSNKEGHPLKKTWEGMIARCYDQNNIGYHLYGGKGVHVVDDWLEFEKFASDAKQLPSSCPNGEKLVLDKDGIGNGFVYGPDTCQWVTPRENSLLKWDKSVVLKNQQGDEFLVSNPTQFCIDQHLPEDANKNLSDLWTGRKNAKERYGFSLVSCNPRKQSIDQISQVINDIKTNPDSRRLIVSSWDVSWVNYMALPPCHLLFQFYVADGKLSCQLYQRSADTLIGLPFNIASYALLTHLVAQQCDLAVGEFVWTGGDVHLYLNHLEQARLQLTRKPYPLPQLKIKRKADSIFTYQFEDFEILDYQAHPHIKAAVAV